jgi:hypothetical protein
MGRKLERFRPFYFRGCDLTEECLPATEGVRVQLPATAPTLQQAERQHAAESPKLSLLRAARRQPAIFRGRGRQAMHLPCKQGYVGAIPTDSTISFIAGNSTDAQREAS